MDFTCIIGASLSEPHINESTFAQLYILFWYVRHAKYVRMCTFLSDDPLPYPTLVLWT
jgi:hypothetical protein